MQVFRDGFYAWLKMRRNTDESLLLSATVCFVLFWLCIEIQVLCVLLSLWLRLGKLGLGVGVSRSRRSVAGAVYVLVECFSVLKHWNISLKRITSPVAESSKVGCKWGCKREPYECSGRCVCVGRGCFALIMHWNISLVCITFPVAVSRKVRCRCGCMRES